MTLSVDNLALSYKKTKVLHAIGFSLAPGDFCALIGPNGSGKSSLTKALLGIVPIETGSVHYRGRNLLGLPRRERARQMAYVPQSSVVPFDLRVFDAVLLGRNPYMGVRYSPEDKRVVEDSLGRLGLLDLADRFVNELSGGQLQRVLIARAFAQGTELLLLDEPTSALDLRFQIETMRLVRAFTQAGGIALMAVHDLNHAARYCNRSLVLSAGRLVAEGPPRQVFTDTLLSEVFGLPIEVTHDGAALTVRPSDETAPASARAA